MNKKVKYTLLGFLIGVVVIGGIALFLVARFFGQSATDATTGYVKAKQEWEKKGVNPIDTAINVANEFVKSELSKDTTIDSTRYD